jgi:exosortase/archaeosortase family protein
VPDRTAVVAVAASAAALWPVLRWYVARTIDRSDEPWGLVALVTAFALAAWRSPTSRPLQPPRLGPAAIALLLYAASFHFASPMCRALFALAVLLLLWRGFGGEPFGQPAVVGLFAMSLPLIATAQYLFGYPMRVLCGAISVALLRMNGLAVSRDGASLIFEGASIAIDAPCSGVKMLWAGVYLALTLSALRRFDLPRTFACACVATVFVMVANSVRVAALFYSETGLWPYDIHAFAGVACFAIVAAGVALTARRLEGRFA